MRPLDDDLLQRYYDGQLSPVEEGTVRSHVAQDPKAQHRLAELARLSELLQGMASEASGELNSDAMFASIRDGIDQDQGQGGPGPLQVITNEWADHKRHLWVPLATAGAIAAAALLTVLRPSPAPTPVAQDEARQQANAPLAGENEIVAAPAGTATAQASGSQVVDVDFGSNAGTVFEIETRGLTTAVVWISDDAAEEEDSP